MSNFFMHAWYPGTREVLDFLQLEIQMLVSHHMGSRKSNLSS